MAIAAGVVAGIVFMVMQMFLMPLLGFAPSMRAPPRMIGAIGLGQEALRPPATFDLTILMVAMVFGAIVARWYKARAHPAEEHSRA